ncbi:MAG: SRPBCC family protein [Luteolibacter sp.]
MASRFDGKTQAVIPGKIPYRDKMSKVPNEIRKSVTLPAPISRVWDALTDPLEFGEWFMVDLDGPFIPGMETTGQITYPDHEHLKWEVMVVDLIPESHFSFAWHPFAVDEEIDYSSETPTLVSFELAPIDGGGCQLTVTESGFDSLPPARRETAHLMNEGGWTIQMESLQRYLEEYPESLG